MNTLFIRILNKLKILDGLNIQGKLSLNDKEFKIPIIQKIGFGNLFITELWMVQLLEIILPIKQGDFIDIGANIGQTLLKVRSVSNKIKYIGFEPNPICVNYLQNLIKINRFEKSELIPVGISNVDELCKLNFYYDNGTDSSASIIEDFRTSQKIARKEYVPIYKVETIEKQIDFNKIGIMKIDVEGAELEVLRSFATLVKIHRPFIIIEILPVYEQKNIKRFDRQIEIEGLLRKLDYQMFRILKNREELIKIEKLDTIGIHKDLSKCEYIFVPKEEESELITSVKKCL